MKHYKLVFEFYYIVSELLEKQSRLSSRDSLFPNFAGFGDQALEKSGLYVFLVPQKSRPSLLREIDGFLQFFALDSDTELYRVFVGLVVTR